MFFLYSNSFFCEMNRVHFLQQSASIYSFQSVNFIFFQLFSRFVSVFQNLSGKICQQFQVIMIFSVIQKFMFRKTICSNQQGFYHRQLFEGYYLTLHRFLSTGITNLVVGHCLNCYSIFHSSLTD